MGVGWKPTGFHLLTFFFIIQNLIVFHKSLAINPDGLALLKFREKIDCDPHGAFANWNCSDSTPCMWFGVHCVDDRVQTLDLRDLSLEGTLAPELGKLSDLRSLVLYKNRFSGNLPKEFGELTKLELLDLRENNLGGTIPAEIGRMLSLRRLLLCDNNFEGSIPSDLGRLNLLSELQFDENLTSMSAPGISCVNRKLGLCIWQSSLKQLNRAESLLMPIKGALIHCLNALPLPLFKLQKDSLDEHQEICCGDEPGSSEQEMAGNIRSVVPFARRRLLEQAKNLQAQPAPAGSSTQPISSQPTTRSSGTYPAVPKPTTKQPHDPAQPSTDQSSNAQPSTDQSSNAQPSGQQSSASNLWKYLIAIPCVVVLLVIVAMVIMCRNRAAKSIGPWKTGLSGQLQKALVTGVPKLNRSELETACEDFSNIIDTVGGHTLYKGTLSSGVEIAVVSVNVSSSKEWSKSSEMYYRRKIDALSRVNHKNFVNLVGYCEEDEPFTRMMVFEYAPNGTVWEHLHVKEMEHLDWNARMRIIMGVSYCVQYMHKDLNPPVALTSLVSKLIYLTDDYAAKVAEDIDFELISRKKSPGDAGAEAELPPLADPEVNVYSFGILLLEIISGKLTYSEEQGSIEKWAAQYLNDKDSISKMTDPSLESFNNEELEIICEVIKDCIQADPRQRPTMADATTKLRTVINIPPEQATPRLSPLWWAELEILSVEAT